MAQPRRDNERVGGNREATQKHVLVEENKGEQKRREIEIGLKMRSKFRILDRCTPANNFEAATGPKGCSGEDNMGRRRLSHG